ncbi:MAG: hypothetical protein BMS9Abin17_0481 [Acidimicrobiia bacterium]|nr:MAG: hypothetical protein BMS9Abin17_0481 [Acidimicrobiia bacterium]
MRRRARRRTLALMSKAWDMSFIGIDLDISMEQIVDELEGPGDRRWSRRERPSVRTARPSDAA